MDVHTLFDIIAGMYMYIEASGRRPGQAAELISPVLPRTRGSCVEFWYHMYGAGIGNLTVSAFQLTTRPIFK